MSGDEWHGNPPRAYGHMVYTERERCPYLYENERSKSSCKNHAHGRSYSMCTGQQNGDRRGAGGQFGYGRDRQFSDFDRKEFYGNRREFSKEHNNYNNANGNFGKKGNINFSMERSHKGMEDGNYGTAGDDSSSEKESIDSGKWSYQSSKDETPTVVNEHKHNLRWGDSWRPRGKGYRSAKGRHKGSGIGHQEKSPSDMSLKDKIYKFGVFLKNEIPQANAIQTIENGLAKCRLGLKINFNVYENKTVRGKPFFMGVLKLSGVIMGQSSGFTKKETKHKAYETALDNLTQKSVDEIFQLKDPVIEAERDKEVVSAKTSNNTCMAIKDAESAQAGNSTVSQNRDEELISADLETNHKTHVQISDADIGQAGNNKLKNEEAVSLESGGYNTHVLINADSVQTGEKNTQIINIPPGQPVNIDQRGNANNVIVNIKVHQERRPSDYVRGSDRYINLKIQMSRRDGLTVVHAEDLENLGLEALKTEEGQLIIRSIETALDVEADGIFKGSIIIRLRQNKDSISKLKSAIETEQLHKILARIVELKKVRFAVLGKHLFLNVTACIPKEDLIEEDKCFTEKGSICIRFKSSSEDVYSKLKTKVENGQLQRILASISEIEPVHSALSRSDLVMNVTASVTEGNERTLASDACTWKSQDQVKLLENDSSDISPSSLPDTSPCTLCKNGMKCLHHSIESEPKTEFDSSVRIKTKVENGQVQRILASTFEIEPVHSAFSRSDPVMNVTASVTEGNERHLASDACTWKSPEQMKLLENDSSDISPSSLPDTSSCTLCKNRMKCLHHRVESEPKTEFDSSVRIRTKVENGQLQRILASTSEIEPDHSALSRSDPDMNVTASVTEGNERPLASDACTWKSQDQVKLLENDSCSDISPSSLPDTSPCTLCKNGMKCLHHSVESEPKTEFDSSVRIRTKVENGQVQRILASTSEIEPDHSALSRSDPDMNVTASVTEGNERPLASDACTWKSQDQVKLLENDSCSDISPSSLPDTSPCTLCKNGMKCLHHSVESEPKTEFDSSVRIKTKVENGQVQRILASTFEIEPVHSAFSRSDPVMNVTASVTEGNERPLASDACTWKSQDQVKLLENDSCSDISPSSLPDTSPCTLCKNGMKCLHHSIEPEPKTEFDSSVRIKTKVENGQLQRILARSFEIGLFHSVSIRCDMAKHVIASLREENERRLASDTCTWKSPEQMKLLENDSSDISPSSLPDTSPCTWCNNGMKCLHHSIESEPKTEFDSSVRIKTKVENGQVQRILARSFEIGLFHSASIRCDMAKHVIASLREENERRLASDTCTWKSREQMKLLENDSSDISPSSSPDELSGSDMVRNTIAHYIEPKKRYLQFLWDKMEHTHLSVEAEPNTEFDSSDMFIDTIHTVRLEKYIEDAITRDLIHRQTQHFQETDFPRDALFIEGINIILSLLNTAKLNLDLLRKDMQDIINTEETMCVSPLCEQSCYLIHIIDMGLNVCGTIYEQIFLDRSSSKLRRIYLLRKRGLGKTTFCRKIIHDWCNAHERRAVAQGGSFQDAAVLPMFDILFSMNLREVSFEKNLIDAICAELPSKHFLGSYLKFNGDKEMFIPDGLNEMIVQANFIENVLTPRPWKISNMELHVKAGFTVNVFMHRLYVKSCYYHHALISEMMFHNRVEIDPFLDLNFFHQRNAQNFAIKPIAKQFTEDILCDMLVTQLIHVPLHVSVQIWCENKMSFLNEVHKNYTLLPIGMAVRIKEKHKRDPNHRQMRFIYDDIQLSLCEVAHDFLLSSEKENSLIFKETNLLNAELGNRVLGKCNKLWKDHLENLWSEEGTDRHRYRELDIINTMYLRYEREVLGETVLVAVSRLCQDQSDFDLQCWNPALLQRLDLTGTRISHVYVNLRGFTELRYLRLHSLNCELYLSQSDSVSVLIMDTLKLSSSCCDVLGSTLTHCTKLERLCIHDTDFHNCVLDLSNMTELTVLDISGVTLSSSCCDVLGSSLTHCTKLERLCIHDTDFHNCVLDLSNMTELTVLDISGVTLSSSCCDVLGSSLTHCTKLERLCIHDTDFHNCVLDLSNMTELTVLDISGVTLSSSCCDVLGSSLTHCTKLERLCIHDTDFHNCVLDLSNMTELTVLDMSGVTLPSSCCDVLGSTLTHCTKLERLCIHDTDFHNCVLDLSNMTELTVLDMSGVTLPSSCCDVLGSTLTHCTKLERLCIHDIDFHNCVLDLSNMTELTVLDMSGLTLSSSCCDVLGSTLTHCTKLERLCIHDTDFHDCVLDLSNMTDLTVLDISGVTLCSSCCDVLGSTLTHCTKLERFCIHDTDFHDCVLDLSNMTELTVLDISGVTLSSICCDVLGSTLTHCTKLERLCIHDTDFHDCVLDLSNMTELAVLDISGVTLSSRCCDVLGSTLTHCTKLERLCIHDTDFHNCLLDLSNMTELTVLDISGVTLSSICCDVLGSTLTHCTKLETLHT